ncbi:MAG: hypothetical protein FD181_2706 [Prolixibacteraceae bacterium]|nr:MAG: hypothetical protein FD181_2706 [Prolixibacteraceae bacterium]
MTTLKKLIDRFRKKPKNFSYDELRRLLGFLGYVEKQGAGSRVVFINEKTKHKIKLHKPHPGKIIKQYQLDFIENELKLKNLV